MKRRLTKQERIQEEATKTKIAVWAFFMGWILIIIIISVNLNADEMVHQFKSPSFSGVGTSSHYLTIENQQFNRKKALADEIKAYQEDLEREKENTTLARFIRNLESRIYAQLSKQLVESMFSNDTASNFGSFALEGSIITWEVITNEDGTDVIKMTIVDTEGTTTIIEIPVGTGNFGQDPDTGTGDGGG